MPKLTLAQMAGPAPLIRAATPPPEDLFAEWVRCLPRAIEGGERLPSPKSYRLFLGGQPELFHPLVSEYLREVGEKSCPLWVMYCRGYFFRSAKFYLAGSQRIFQVFCKTFADIDQLTIAYSLQLTELLEQYPGLVRMKELHPCLLKENPMYIARIEALTKKHGEALNTADCVKYFPHGFRREKTGLSGVNLRGVPISNLLGTTSPFGWAGFEDDVRDPKRRRSSGTGFRPVSDKS